MQLLYPCKKIHGKQHPEWAYDAVLYELNMRQFTTEGTFVAAAKELPRLKKLGVDVIWLMPIFPIGEQRRKGSLGSYYSIRDYRAVNPEFGTMDDFRAFLQQAHNEGVKVILDWVPNHTSRDADWTIEHPDWYEFDTEKNEIATPFDWTDTAKLDYSQQAMREEMVAAMKFWLSQGIDGFRCDMAMLQPIDFWDWATPELEQVKPDIFMLAEAEGVEFHRRAFDATYAWDMHHLLVKIAQGQANADSLRERLKWEAFHYPEQAIRMQFTSNHDENSWSDTEFVRFGAAAKAMAALTYILPGIPLIYNGQEVAQPRRLAFFDKDAIEWGAPNDFSDLYEKLSSLKHAHPALRAGEQGGDLYSIDNSEQWRIFAVKRKIGEQTVIALFNFSGADAWVKFWDEDFNGEYNQLLSNDKAQLTSDSDFLLAPWGWFVYWR